ncbi:hypothetical protein C5O00_06885 [Pukyongia salina]|uniref:Uncharacterized protein n=1 Tax=Pukyongia salina TaxID=2094025 RepID=A0A2S0HXM0_9FLAO|nr:hypothetical protein [Pukyongia salina]AVI50913.1 hypothetical protein C5O00_06885 [Pukyongia salina]
MKSDSITNRILFILFLTIVSFGCKDATTTATAESTDLITEATESSTKLSSTSDPKDNGEVRFILDGVEWVSGPPGHPEMNFEEEAITDDKTMVRIEAYSADGSSFALTIFKQAGIGPGTFSITDPGMRGFYATNNAEGDTYLTNGMDSNPGSVTISSLTEDGVEGTFQFAIRNSGDPEDIKQLTNGTFNLKFTRI